MSYLCHFQFPKLDRLPPPPNSPKRRIVFQRATISQSSTLGGCFFSPCPPCLFAQEHELWRSPNSVYFSKATWFLAGSLPPSHTFPWQPHSCWLKRLLIRGFCKCPIRLHGSVSLHGSSVTSIRRLVQDLPNSTQPIPFLTIPLQSSPILSLSSSRSGFRSWLSTRGGASVLRFHPLCHTSTHGQPPLPLAPDK